MAYHRTSIPKAKSPLTPLCKGGLGGISILLALAFAVACGAAATATPVPKAVAPEAPKSPAAAQPAAPAAPAVAPTATPAPAAKPAPAATLAAAVVNPGKITWMISGWGNERFDPAHFVGENNNSMRLMQGFLIATNEKTELIPGMATDWRISTDGLTWTVNMRKGVKFHDGTELTAEDVLWSWRHIWSTESLAYSTGIGAQANARIWDKAELTGPDKVSITHKIKNPAFVTADISEAGPSHYAIMPKRATLHDEALEAAYDRNPIGTGALKLVRRVPASVMEFERFDDYYYQPKNGLPEDKRVKFKFLNLRLVPEEATRVAALRAGEADVAPVSLGSKKQVEAGGGRLVFGREGVAFLAFLGTCWAKPEAPCNDKRVRQALDYAIDKELMMDKLYGGPTVAQAKGWASVTPSTIGYSPELDPWPFNPNKARQLLAEAGYPGGKGFGKLIVNTWLSPSTPLLPESAQLAADFWRKELGIDVEVKVGEAAALKKAWLSQELNGQVLWRDNEARLDASGWARNFYGIPTAGNRFHNDPKLFEEVQKAIGVFDPVEGPIALNNLYRRLRDESYEFGIGYLNIPWAVGPRIATWQPYPQAFYPSGLHTMTLK